MNVTHEAVSSDPNPSRAVLWLLGRRGRIEEGAPANEHPILCTQNTEGDGLRATAVKVWDACGGFRPG